MLKRQQRRVYMVPRGRDKNTTSRYPPKSLAELETQLARQLEARLFQYDCPSNSDSELGATPS